MALGKVRGMQPPGRDDADEKQQMRSSRWGLAGRMGMRWGQPVRGMPIPRMEEFREYPGMGK